MISILTPQVESAAEIRRRLNIRKHHLEFRKDATVKDWIDLAGQYAEIGSRANFAYCMNEADLLITDIDPDDLPADSSNADRQ